MEDKFSPLQLLLSCFGVSSLAGIAQLLRSGKPIEFRKIVGAGLYSGIVGLIVAMLLYDYLVAANYILLIGVSGLAGLGGSNVLDVLVQAWQNGGIQVVFTPVDKDKAKKGPDTEVEDEPEP